MPGRWAAVGGAVAAAVAGVLAWSLAAGGAACAAVAADGRATFYTPPNPGGNCSFPGWPDDGLYVALGPSQYRAGAACGGYLDVTGPDGSVRVKVVDQCPECEPGHLDLSRAAFARIADPVRGLVDVSYREVVDPPAARLSLRVKEGSSQWWLALLVDGHGNPLRSVEVRRDGGWSALARTDYNYWIAETGAGTGPFTVRVTDARGHRRTVEGIRLQPGQVQRTAVRLYGSPAPSTPAASPTRAAPTRTPAPTRPPTIAPSPPSTVVAAAPVAATSSAPASPASPVAAAAPRC